MTDLNLRRRLSVETDPETGSIRVREFKRYDSLTLTIVFAVIFVWALLSLRSMANIDGNVEYLIAAVPAALAAYGMYLFSLRRNPDRDVVTDELGPQAFEEATIVANSGTPADKDECARLVLQALGLPATPADYKRSASVYEDETNDEHVGAV